nr:L-Ala-D/L-Glu epimerase [Streptococcus thermophilus]
MLGNSFLPDPNDILDRAHVVSLPMAVRFRGITTREALLIDGPAGWGEFSPFLEYSDEEAAAWLRAGLEAAYEGYEGLGGPSEVEVNGTIPAVTPDEVPYVLARFEGVRTFKIKVAEPRRTLADDVARLKAVHELRPDAVLRVDANGGWTVQEAIAAARAFEEILPPADTASAGTTPDPARGGYLEYIEQPCRTAEELAEVRRRVSTPIAADESIRKVADPYRVVKLAAADVAVCKVAPLGGVRNLARIARDLDLRITVASALDTAVGIHAGLVAAAAAGSQAAGLATQRLFLEDVADPFPIVDGRISINPSELFAPDADRVAGLKASSIRKDWWFYRLRRCMAYV